MKKLAKHLKTYILVLLLAYVVVLSINKYFNSNFTNYSYVTTFFNVFIYCTSIYLANTFFIKQFFDNVSISNLKFKIALGYWVALISAFFTSVLVEFFVRVLIYKTEITEVFNIIFSEKLIPNYFLIFSITTLVYIFFAYKSKQENKVREHKIVAQTASAKFETLKSQIDPHFLFNSLNVLTSLIEENPDKAQQFTIALSKIYRYVLEQRNKDLVSLNEELDFAKTFIKLLKLRFEDALEINLPATILDQEAKVIPLVLQLLLENAVKHNVVNVDQKLIININVQDNVLVVTNNFQPKNILNNESTGFGLQHIIHQYDLVTDRKVLIKQSDTSFEVYLPILTQKIITEVDMDLEFKTEDLVYKRAKERVKDLKNFYTSLGSFLFLVVVYITLRYTGIKHPMLFWMPIAIAIFALSLLIQSLTIFGLRNWEQNKINNLMNRYKNK